MMRYILAALAAFFALPAQAASPQFDSVLYKGSASGVITTQPQAAAGTWNWNFPITAGSSGQVLASAGGVAAPMTWTTLATVGTSGSASDLGSGTLAAARLPTITGQVCATWDSTLAVTAMTIEFPIPWATYTVTGMKSAVSGGGSFSVAAKIAGTNITSLSAVSVSGTSNTNTTATGANTGVADDQITLVTSSPSGTINQAYVCLVITHSVN